MIFNSVAFFLFFIAFFFIYWLVFKQSVKLQNIFLLTGCYVFYAWWDWRFLALLAGSSLLTYYLGINIAKTQNEKKKTWLLYAGLLQGIGLLVFFKYYNFFVTSFTEAFSFLNIKLHLQTLQLILPLGISFYTFRSISYLLDIKNEEIEPTTNGVVFFSYVAFFPSLVSGPIDRAKLLIPQLEKKREFNYNLAADGMRRILWGMFKKVVVADNIAIATDQIFDGYATMPASSLVLGAIFYAIQLYADFSGYSEMAMGFANLLGFNITKNFNYPFFAQNIAQFWQRWHISLTSWMTEYVFTPLSFIFRRKGKTGVILAIMINFLLVGLWHGSNWTFIWFGFMHGLYFIPLILKGTINKTPDISTIKTFPSFTEFRKIVGTFALVAATIIIFRCGSVTHTLQYYRHIFSASIMSKPVFTLNMNTIAGIIFSVVLIITEWLGRGQDYAIAGVNTRFSKPVRWTIYYTLALIIFLFAGKEQQFIYLQF